MRSVIFATLFLMTLLIIKPTLLLSATIWVAAEYYDDIVDDKGDGVDAFTFKGRDAITGGGIYFTEKNPVQGAITTTYFEYDLGKCPKDADGKIWYAWGRFEWTGNISGCNSFGLMWLQSNGAWSDAKNFGNDEPFLKPWHWKDLDGGATLSALKAGDPIKVRITERESQTKPELTPLLDVFCLTTDQAYRPQDGDVPKLSQKAVEFGRKMSIAWARIKEN